MTREEGIARLRELGFTATADNLGDGTTDPQQDFFLIDTDIDAAEACIDADDVDAAAAGYAACDEARRIVKELARVEVPA